MALPLLLSCSDALTGKQLAVDYIEKNRYQEAAAVLDELLADKPDDQTLHYLAGIAAFGESVDQINFVTTLILAIVFGDFDAIQGGLKPGAGKTENDFALALIDHIVEYLREPATRAADHLDRVRDANVRLKFDDFQLRFWQTDFVELSGVWDAADAAFLQASIEPLAAGLDIAAAHNLHTDVQLAIARIGGPTPAAGIPGYANIAVQLLNSAEYPDFLNLNPGGDVFMDGARQRWGRFATRWLEFIALAEARPKNASGIFQVVNDGGKRLLRLEDRVRMSPDSYFDLSFRLVTDSTFQTFDLQMPESFALALAGIADNMAELGGGPRLTLATHVLPLAVPVALALLNHISLSSTIESALSFIGKNPDAAVDVIADFIPAGLELDPAAWFASGYGLRRFLPAHRSDLAAGDNNFLLEWECPAFFSAATAGTTGAFPGGLACPDGEDEDFENVPEDDFALVDSGHFDGAAFAAVGIEPIAADGLATGWPILAFGDPSWAGMLYFDGSETIEFDPPASGMRLADNRTFNAWIAVLSDIVGSFL